MYKLQPVTAVGRQNLQTLIRTQPRWVGKSCWQHWLGTQLETLIGLQSFEQQAFPDKAAPPSWVFISPTNSSPHRTRSIHDHAAQIYSLTHHATQHHPPSSRHPDPPAFTTTGLPIFHSQCVCVCMHVCVCFQGTPCSLHLQHGARDDLQTLLQLQLVDDKGRGKTDDVTVCGLGQQTIVPELEAHVPGAVLCKENGPKAETAAYGHRKPYWYHTGVSSSPRYF